MPGFCRPMALSMPPYTSAIRGVGFPSQGTFDTPFVTMPPKRFKSINCAYSSPAPNVPDAARMGFLNVIPAMFTFVFIKYPPPLRRKPDLRCRSVYCAPANGCLCVRSCRHSPGRRLRRMPYVLPVIYSILFRVLLHMFLMPLASASARRRR